MWILNFSIAEGVGLYSVKFIQSLDRFNRRGRVTVCGGRVLERGGGGGGGHEGRFSRDPLSVFFFFFLRKTTMSSSDMGSVVHSFMLSTLWCCPSSISSADRGVTHPPRCHEGWFWGGCRDARTVRVSVSWLLSVEVLVGHKKVDGAHKNSQCETTYSL